MPFPPAMQKQGEPALCQLRPEFRLLIACSGTHSSNEIQRLLGAPVDWDYLFHIAGWHGMVPLLADRLLKNTGTLADHIVQRLREYARQNAQQNLRLSAELVRIAAKFETNALECISYKGVTLSQYLYGTTALRCNSDIDLIVRRRDRDKAGKCLSELGYQDAYNFRPHQKAAALRYGFEYSYSTREVAVDLHWQLVQRYAWSLPEDEVWRHVAPFRFNGRTLQLFSPELMLASLCVHAAQHDWAYLKMFADIADFLSTHPDLDWNRLQSLATDSHARRSMQVSLKLATAYLGAQVPPQVLTTLDRDPQVSRIAYAVFSDFWQAYEDPFPAPMNLRWLLFRTLGERICARVRYIAGVILWPTLADFQAVGLPPYLNWLHFVIRPLRIATKRLKR